MTSELQWEGFASVAESGIREALYAAGVDCAMSACHEPESITGSELDQHMHGQPTC